MRGFRVAVEEEGGAGEERWTVDGWVDVEVRVAKGESGRAGVYSYVQAERVSTDETDGRSLGLDVWKLTSVLTLLMLPSLELLLRLPLPGVDSVPSSSTIISRLIPPASSDCSEKERGGAPYREGTNGASRFEGSSSGS